MRSTLFILCIALCCSCNNNNSTTSAQQAAANAPGVSVNSSPAGILTASGNATKTVEIVRGDFNDDGVTDSLLLQNPPLNDDPGQFSHIVFHVSGMPVQGFSSTDVWDYIDGPFDTKNEVASKRVFVTKTQQGVFVVLFGFTYGSGRDCFDILQLDGQVVRKIFSQPIQEPIGFEALHGDDGLYFIGRPDYEAEVSDVDHDKGLVTTYAPYIVYDLLHNCNIDTALTREYNQQHYVWQGLHYSDSIKVVHAAHEPVRLYP